MENLLKGVLNFVLNSKNSKTLFYTVIFTTGFSLIGLSTTELTQQNMLLYIGLWFATIIPIYFCIKATRCRWKHYQERKIDRYVMHILNNLPARRCFFEGMDDQSLSLLYDLFTQKYGPKPVEYPNPCVELLHQKKIVAISYLERNGRKIVNFSLRPHVKELIQAESDYIRTRLGIEEEDDE